MKDKPFGLLQLSRHRSQPNVLVRSCCCCQSSKVTQPPSLYRCSAVTSSAHSPVPVLFQYSVHSLP